MTTIKPSEATATNPTKEYFGTFYPLFREHSHRLIHWGYEGARHRIQHPRDDKDREETSITGFLVKTIRDRLKDFVQEEWVKNYSVHENRPVEAEERSGIRRPIPDIIIEFTSNGRPEYVFEAKRLKERGRSVTGYTGSDGMDCFISGKYAGRYNEAGMLGYVQIDGLEEWKDKVKGKIDQDAEKLSLIEGSQQDERVINDFPTEWVSEHNRNSLPHSITIYHILLDCCVE